MKFMKNSVGFLPFILVIGFFVYDWYSVIMDEDNRQEHSSWVIIPRGDFENACTPNAIKEIKLGNDGNAIVVMHDDREVLTSVTVEQMNARWEKAKANGRR